MDKLVWLFRATLASCSQRKRADLGKKLSPAFTSIILHYNSVLLWLFFVRRSFYTGSPKSDSHNAGKGKKKCLALDLDETLVHSSFQPVDNASFVISVVIEGVVHTVYVIKRPGNCHICPSLTTSVYAAVDHDSLPDD